MKIVRQLLDKFMALILLLVDARALFERVIGTFPPDRARPLWERWARHEYQYGDLAAAQKLEKRMAEAYPNGENLQRSGSPLLTSCQIHPLSVLPNATLTTQRMLSQHVISVLRSCDKTVARPVTVAPAIHSGARKHRHPSWRVVARHNPHRLRRLRRCITSGPPPRITNGGILIRMGLRNISGHEPLRRLDATAIDGTATEVEEKGITAQVGIVIASAMLCRRHHHKRPNGEPETKRKRRLLTSHRSSRGSSARYRDQMRSMVSGPMCNRQSSPLARTLTTMGRTGVPHG
jgi:hypothetical protein